MNHLERDEDEVVVVHDRAGVDVAVKVHHEDGLEIIEVDIEKCGRDNRPPPHAHRYRVKVDHIYHVIAKRFVTSRELLQIAGKTPAEKYELEKRMHSGAYESLELDEEVDLGQPGIEVFETFPLDETEG